MAPSGQATRTVGVVDYRAGNARSVVYAFDRLGIASRLVRTPADAAAVGLLALPGVGSAPATMRSLDEQGLIEPLNMRVRQAGVPFLGICIGMQLLFERSDEGNERCLGWLPGTVRRFDASVRIPQMGWNSVRFTRDHALSRAAPDRTEVYFVNSYYAVPARESDVLGVTDYGGAFCSMVAHENVLGVQFHIEKSGPVGLRLLRAFAAEAST